jgi:DNA-binding transcriptional ArsR family regulator
MRVFVALADETRRAIVEALAAREQPVGDLVSRFGMSQPAMSRHLRVLREAGLVRVRPDGQRRVYRVDAQGLEAIDAWLASHRRKMARQLDALERHMDADERSKGSRNEKGKSK